MLINRTKKPDDELVKLIGVYNSVELNKEIDTKKHHKKN